MPARELRRRKLQIVGSLQEIEKQRERETEVSDTLFLLSSHLCLPRSPPTSPSHYPPAHQVDITLSFAAVSYIRFLFRRHPRYFQYHPPTPPNNRATNCKFLPDLPPPRAGLFTIASCDFYLVKGKPTLIRYLQLLGPSHIRRLFYRMQSFTALAVVVATLFELISSQSIDPNSVDIATRGMGIHSISNVDQDADLSLDDWCTKQKASCPLLCLQIPGATAGTEANSCDPVRVPLQAHAAIADKFRPP